MGVVILKQKYNDMELLALSGTLYNDLASEIGLSSRDILDQLLEITQELALREKGVL